MERISDTPVYFTAPDGTRYQVFDTAWDTTQGREVRAHPPAEWATNRVFIAEDGARRFYPLAFCALHGETHEPRPEWLARQFARSERGGKMQSQPLGARPVPAVTSTVD